MSTKVCPKCSAELGRSARQCECGQLFGKAAGIPAKQSKKKKKAGKRRPQTALIPLAPPENKAAAVSEPPFRVGIFNDGGMAIINERGGLELGADQALQLASFCREQFAVEEA